MNRIVVEVTKRSFAKEALRVRSVARITLRLLKKDGYTLNLFLLSLLEIQKINYQWRKKNTPTNVISFAECDSEEQFPKQSFNKNHLGEIYMSTEFIRVHQQSIDHMVVHGILHLLGYDHIKKIDAEKMERREQWLLSRITKKS